MNLLNTLTIAADEEQLRLRPLPVHAATTQEEHLSRHYALLLAAVLTSQPAVSEPQTRLLRLLLDALKLGDIRGPLFEQARELTPEPLLEAARLIREAGFAHHLVLDVLVLLRLDAPLGDESARLAGELAAFLGLDEAELATRARDAVDILGLKTKTEEGDHSNSGKEGDSDGAEDAAECPALLAELWPGRLSQPLTAEALRSGLQGGLWLLDANLDVGFPWQANDAILVFRNGATLNTFAKEGEIKLTGCRLVDAALDFQGACSITLERCDWQGDYDLATARTALNSKGQALIITHCQFSTRNARAIAIQNNSLTLTESRFTRCGHTELDGGAVWLYSQAGNNYLFSFNDYRIDDCRFDRCTAARGGALWVDDLHDVSQCEFVACESSALQDQQANDVAVFSATNCGDPVLTRCVFRQTSISVGNSYSGKRRKIAVDCQFIGGNLYYFKSDGHTFGARSTFDGGCVVEKDFGATVCGGFVAQISPRASFPYPGRI